MKVLFVGEFTQGVAGEGLRNISSAIADPFLKQGRAVTVGTRTAASGRGLRLALEYAPDIIHHLTGPTIRSLATLATLKRVVPSSPVTVATASRPVFGWLGRRAMRRLAPDLVLTQDAAWERVFAHSGFATRFLPNGVDLGRFRPPSLDEKTTLRRNLRLPADKRLYLHVGHLKANRNLETLSRIRLEADALGLVVGSALAGQSDAIARQLRLSGWTVLSGYLPRIEDIYRAADCYVFPVCRPSTGGLRTTLEDGGAIDTPLSVLEAMATNLAVLTTPYGALPRMFQPGRGLQYFDGTAPSLLAAMRRLPPEGNFMTRECVMKLDWCNVHRLLAETYANLLAAR